MKKIMTLLGSFLVAMGIKAEAAPIARKETFPAPKTSQGDTTVPVQSTLKTTNQVVNQKAVKGNTLTMKELPSKDFKYYKGGNKDSLTTPVKGKSTNIPIKINPTTDKVPLKNGATLPVKQ